ncbi:hypothetical protein [Actinomadura sp. 3N508]|uniref:hypothetical protein n=1 Tax=Actinomadura sp. 3N508 TaxID=3375153 RepID=UPI0037A47C0B
MTSPPQEVVFENTAKGLPLVFGSLIIIAGGATWLGLRLGGWVGICLFVVAGLLLTLMVYITQSMLRVGPSMLLLTPEGLVYKVGGKRDVVPPEAIEAVGLVRRKDVGANLILWFDASRMPEVPKNIRRREKPPGQIVLTVVMDERDSFPPERVREVRELVQAHGLGEWRNRSAAT